jgi:hypothetical protein
MADEQLPWPYEGLLRFDLDPSAQELPFDIIDWHPHNGKQYACISCESEAYFLESERRRGHCTLVRHKPNKPDKKCLKNVTYLCSYSKERRADRKARQQLGHAAAAQFVQDRRKKSSDPPAQQGIGEAQRVAAAIKRVGKNSTGEAVTCADCQYRLQLKEFRKRPGCVYLVLNGSKHTDSDGSVAHGPSSGQHVVQKRAPAELRQFILAHHKAGVPPARILQGALALFDAVDTCFRWYNVMFNGTLSSLLQSATKGLLRAMGLLICQLTSDMLN